ncbi:MAG: hypothetical protein K2Y14_03245 [Burkholderiales bacterium]|nr:hypothetical protein [Burkholderiales bacterium]
MKHIQPNHTNAWLICRGIMLNSHNRSDYSQIAGVFLEHTHPAKAALSSTRVLSMQGFALFHAYFAGRCNKQSIHPPPSRTARDQPISQQRYRLPAVGWTPIINRLVSCF